MNELKRRLKEKKGFTLAELLVVVAIIAVLVAVAIPTFSAAKDKADAAVEQANARSAYAEAMVSYLSKDTTNFTVSYEDGRTYTCTVTKETDSTGAIVKVGVAKTDSSSNVTIHKSEYSYTSGTGKTAS